MKRLTMNGNRMMWLMAALCGLMAMTGCQQQPKQTLADLTYDTVTFHQQVPDGQEGISYDIELILPKVGFSPATDSVRDYLLRESMANYTDSFADVTGLLDAQQAISRMKKALDNDHRDFLNDMGEGSHEPTPWERTVKVAPQLVDSNAIEYLVAITDYEGGAHGSYFLDDCNFDPRNGRRIGPQQLLKKGSDHAWDSLLMVALRRYAKECLEDPEEDFWTEDVHPTENFEIKYDSLYFFYNQYEIAPYAMGLIELSLSADEVRDYLNPDCPVARRLRGSK